MEQVIGKINISKMKEDIKVKVENQKFLRNQRKTVNLVGERKMPPHVASYKHSQNGEDLRIMYASYGIARGKTFSQIENHYAEDNHPLISYQKNIDKVLMKYAKQIKVEVEV